MLLQQCDVEKLFSQNSYNCTRTTKKVIEFQSEKNKKIVYFYVKNGLDKYLSSYNHIRIVIHPHEDISSLIKLAGVEVNLMNEFHSNMITFPSKINKGKTECHYGIGFNVLPSAVNKFLENFHK